MESLPDSAHRNPRWPHIPISNPWVIVLLSALLLLIANINNNTFGVFFKPISEEFEWSREVVAGAIAIRALIIAAFALLTGYLSDRYGPRRIILASYLLLGLGFLLFSRVTSLWHLYLIQSLIMGVGLSAPFVCLMATVAKWHKTKPGLALGITSAGTGLSSVIFPPIAAMLIESMGWQYAMIVLGLVTIIVAVPASIFIKDPPLVEEQRSVVPNEHKSPFTVWRIFPGLLKNRVFLAVVLVFLLFYITCNLLLVHLVNYVTDMGISPIIAASMMSVMGIVGTLSRFGMGIISDRIGTKTDTAVCCATVILSLILLIFKIPVLIWISVALFGIGYGGMAPLIPAIIGDHFGWERLSTLTGAAMVGANLGAAIGPWMGGFIFDVSSSYFWALAVCAALTIVALVIVLRMPSTRSSRV